uniref:Uncharacterized protein n=1 Tax=Cannabis sativa TaxID=3483 RepID=A0A803NRG7_CANSA
MVFALPEDVAPTPTPHSNHVFLVRVLTDNYFHKSAFIDQMSGHWKDHYPAVISDYGDDLFKVSFSCVGDKFKVQIYCLHFLSKSKALAKALSELIGEFIEIQEDSFNEG